MAYLLDANVFIQAKNLHYGFDFCPAFWEWILAANADGRVFSIERVADELSAGEDDLAAWADAHAELFLPLDATVLPSLTEVARWASSADYEPAAVNTFLQVADYYLVAQAQASGFIVVTHEKAATTPKKVKIPNSCIGLGIKFLNPFEMLRAERARFVLPA